MFFSIETPHCPGTSAVEVLHKSSEGSLLQRNVRVFWSAAVVPWCHGGRCGRKAARNFHRDIYIYNYIYNYIFIEI